MDGDDSHQPETFSLRIRRDAPGRPLRVVSAELARSGFDHRLGFGRHNLLAEVLHPRLAAFVEMVLTTALDDAPRVFAEPETTLALPGLMLGRLRVAVSAPDGDVREAALRFRYFVGGLQNAFATRTGFDRPAEPHAEAIGMRALEDVALPLLNMAMTARTWTGEAGAPTGAPAVTAALAAIEANAVELDFYAGLLRRYVTECAPGRRAELDAFEDPVRRVMEMAEPPVPALRPRD